MRSIDTVVQIDAEPARVWQVLTDFPAYPAWNPFFVAVDGRPEPGSPLELHTKITATSKPRIFRVKARIVDAPHRLVWGGGLAVRGIADGEHGFELRSADGGTTVRHYEHFSGLIVPLAGRALSALEGRYHELNRALAERATQARRVR